MKSVESFRLSGRHRDLLDKAPGSRSDTVRFLIESVLDNGREEGFDEFLAYFLFRRFEESGRGVYRRAAEALLADADRCDGQEVLG